MKCIEAVNLWNAIDILRRSSQSFPIKFTYALNRNAKFLEPEIQAFHETMRSIDAEDDDVLRSFEAGRQELAGKLNAGEMTNDAFNQAFWELTEQQPEGFSRYRMKCRRISDLYIQEINILVHQVALETFPEELPGNIMSALIPIVSS